MPRTRSSGRLKRAAIDLLLLAVIAYLGHWIVSSAVASSNAKASLLVVEQEAQLLYESFDRYYERHRVFPGSHREPQFDLLTLDPLRKRGYYSGTLPRNLLDARIDAYESPDDQGSNREFWLEMTLADDPSIRILVARSNDAPMAGGVWCDGVYVYRNGILEPR